MTSGGSVAVVNVDEVVSSGGTPSGSSRRVETKTLIDLLAGSEGVNVYFVPLTAGAPGSKHTEFAVNTTLPPLQEVDRFDGARLKSRTIGVESPTGPAPSAGEIVTLRPGRVWNVEVVSVAGTPSAARTPAVT